MHPVKVSEGRYLGKFTFPSNASGLNFCCWVLPFVIVKVEDPKMPEMIVARTKLANVDDRTLEKSKAEYQKLQAHGSQKSSKASGRNRGDVGVAVEALSSQIRAKIKALVKHQGGTPHDRLMQIFAGFDSNSDGNIDKAEMSLGCRRLGVIITEAELDLIWPYFDTDDSGEVDFGEFWEFVQKSGAKGLAHRARAKELHESELKTSVKLRKRRIRQKTRYVGAKHRRTCHL